MIYTREPLDRESQPYYWLTVYAQDSGSVPLSSMIEVFIVVEDVNDNLPQTAEPAYHAAVQEGSPEGTAVIRLEGYDLDSTANSLFVYSISAGNPRNFFAINSVTGIVMFAYTDFIFIDIKSFCLASRGLRGTV